VHDWMIANYQWLIGTIIGIVIAYHVYFLSKKLTARDRLEHKERIKARADEIINDIEKNDLRRKVLLVNVNRYFKDYPSNVEKVSGYSVIAGEVKATRHDGVEFFCSSPRAVYRGKDGRLSFSCLSDKEKAMTVFPVGVVPYDWIVHVDPEGDEFDYYPIFYTKFRGSVYWSWWRRMIPFGYPYSRLVYYRISDHYQDGSDSFNMKYIQVHDKIDL